MYRGHTVHQPSEAKIQSKKACSGMWEPFPATLSFNFSYHTIPADVGAAPAPRRPNVQMPDEYLPPNKILFLQNLPETVTKDQLNTLFSQYPNLHEVRLVPSKKDIAFVEYLDEGSATVAKDALHNYKLDGENKIKVWPFTQPSRSISSILFPRLPSPGNKTAGFKCGCLATNLESPADASPFHVLSGDSVRCIAYVCNANNDPWMRNSALGNCPMCNTMCMRDVNISQTGHSRRERLGLSP